MNPIRITVLHVSTALALLIALPASSIAAENNKFDWQSNPQAYAPDGLSDYSGDYTTSTPVTLNLDWHSNPQAYAPDGLSDYSEDYSRDSSTDAAKVSYKPSPKYKPVRHYKQDWLSNPQDYAPDDLSDYGADYTIKAPAAPVAKVEQKITPRPVVKVIYKSSPVRQYKQDWLSNPQDYAPDDLSDYGADYRTELRVSKVAVQFRGY